MSGDLLAALEARAGELGQVLRRQAVLRDVHRSGGRDSWSHLHSHGHPYASVASCVTRGFLTEPRSYNYELTEAGRAALRSQAGRDE